MVKITGQRNQMHRIHFLSSYLKYLIVSSYFWHQNIFLYNIFSSTKLYSCIKLFLAPKHLLVSNFAPKYLCFFSYFFNLYIFSTMAPPLFPKLDNSSEKA